MAQPKPEVHLSRLGALLRHWRGARGLSQLELSLEAGVSARHISFVETGRATASREMVLSLARALGVPLRERNALLEAAGFAAVYRETSLESLEMAPVRQALQLLLKDAEPFGAVVLDRRWEALMVNQGDARLMTMTGVTGSLLPAYEVLPRPRLNIVANLQGPLGHAILNKEEVRASLLERLQREVWADRDPERQALLQSLVGEARPVSLTGPALMVPVELRLPTGQVARLFSTIATLGTPQDVTLQELRIESFHPADEATAALGRMWASS